jgi:hypothetical protein
MSSPDDSLDAVVFRRDCGATTGLSTQISLLRKGTSLPNGPGNVFSADTNYGVAPSAKWGGPPVDVKWSAKRTLIVVTDPAARIFRQDSLVAVSAGLLSQKNVAVEYVLRGDKQP